MVFNQNMEKINTNCCLQMMLLLLVMRINILLFHMFRLHFLGVLSFLVYYVLKIVLFSVYNCSKNDALKFLIEK